MNVKTDTEVTTTDQAKVRLSPPPPGLMRVVNPLVRRVLASPRLGRRVALQGLLEFKGRQSGRRYRVPVCLHDIDGVTIVFTERPWRRNLAGGAPVVVIHRGVRRNGRAELLQVSPTEIGTAMAAAMANGASPFELGLKVKRGHQPTVADLSTIARQLIRIDFDS